MPGSGGGGGERAHTAAAPTTTLRRAPFLLSPHLPFSPNRNPNNQLNHSNKHQTNTSPTEIVAFSDRIKEFHAIGAEVVGCSVDSHFSHLVRC